MRRHVPVLLEETLDACPEHASVFLDGTLWHGWHTQEFLERFPDIKVIGVDKDIQMIEKAEQFIGESYTDRFVALQASYHEFDCIAKASWEEKFDYIFVDLGVNMDHFKEADRWFSIKLEGDLDMRYDTSKGMSVKQRLVKTHFQEMNEVFSLYTDFWQRYREQCVRDLLKARKKTPFHTTQDVRKRAKSADINDKVLAIIFQAWRIYINDELWALDSFLKEFHHYLLPWGRCCVITYHSGEDRLVKFSFKDLVDNWVWILYNKKVIKPSRQESESNRASRSAKMRIIQKS